MLFVFAGPSGIGKSFIMERLLARYPEKFVVPKLLTTRQPRPGEEAVDRQFITQDEFDDMKNNGRLAFAEEFNGNWYGCTEEDIVSKRKHVLMNAWPTLLQQFIGRPGLVIIGMTMEPQGVALLEKRIRSRGDSPEVFAKRMERVRIDLADLQTHDRLVQDHGKLFIIENDSSVDAIEAWIVANYL